MRENHDDQRAPATRDAGDESQPANLNLDSGHGGNAPSGDDEPWDTVARLRGELDEPGAPEDA